MLTFGSPQLCSRFAKFQGVFTAVSVMVAELMLVLRVYAVHHQSKVILAIILSIWSAQLACISYVLAHTLPAPLPRTPITFGCFLISDPAIGNRYILYIAPSMVFDTTIFLMLSTAIYKRAKEHPLTTMLQIILRDGILYFTVVLLLNAAWLTTALTLPLCEAHRTSYYIDYRSDRPLFSSYGLLISPCVVMTVTLIGRLTLNLRKGSTSVIFDTSTNGDGRIRRFVNLESGDASTGVGGVGFGYLLNIRKSLLQYIVPRRN
ncbi:hypothetical protein ONZ45_g3697 [Pleurotus djamor]|nr:hypothetical protein ONZ45_g3697 [Pleurotus djamor]